MLKKIEHFIGHLADLLGKLSAILLLLLVLNVFYDVIMRYVFNDVSIGMQELEWHLFSVVFLLGIPYTLQHDGHVRVDLIYERLSVKQQTVIDLLGYLCFVLPFAALVAYYGWGFAEESFKLAEKSGDPGGLHYRWLIKGAIPFSFAALLLTTVGLVLRSFRVLQPDPKT